MHFVGLELVAGVMLVWCGVAMNSLHVPRICSPIPCQGLHHDGDRGVILLMEVLESFPQHNYLLASDFGIPLDDFPNLHAFLMCFDGLLELPTYLLLPPCDHHL